MKKDTLIPPKLAQRLLYLFLRDDLAEEVSGDLEEKFYLTLKHKSKWRAQWNYWYQVLNYVRPFALRRSRSMSQNKFIMFQSYFKIATRSLLKQKLYSAINIGGLALGLSCFIIILLYVQHEFSYDRFYNNVDQIYRVYQKQTGNVFMGTDYFAVTPAQLATNLREEFPEVKSATSVEQSSGLLEVGDNHFLESGLAGDYQFFEVFPLTFVSGNPKNVFTDSKSIVLTKTLAKTIFGDQDPIGQLIKYQNIDGYTVTGVVDDPPSNSSLKYSFIINLLYNEMYAQDLKRSGWHNNSVHTFILLDENAKASAVSQKLPALVKKYQQEEDYKNYPFKDEYFIQPFTELYFQSNVNFDVGLKGNRKSIYLFSAVALIILILACVNYMNLAIARSIKRSREVGLRKVVGAIRKQVISQFLGESILITFISLLFAIGLVYILLPVFGRIIERPIELDFTSNPVLLPGLAILVILVGLFSGSYPAFVMSSLKPIQVLKAKADVKISGFNLQRVLIVAQFAASITLVIGSLVIHKQLNYIQHKELGYTKENIVTIRLSDRSLRDKFQSLSNEWQQNPAILAATMSSHLPTNITSSSMIKRPGSLSDKVELAIYQFAGGYDVLDVFDIKLLAGRDFSQDVKSDEDQACMINETAAKALGWTAEEAINKQIDLGGQTTVIGVVKDFHMHSMHLSIQPLIIRLSTQRGNYFSLKVKKDNIAATLAFIEKTIKQHSPYPFQYEFLDDNYNNLYQSEMKLGEIFGFFTIVSILIASLGLFGLAAFMADQRTKEIGIRKILGASVNNILLLLSKDFLSLVLLAFITAAPIGWYAMNKWLQEFAYRIDIGWWMFAVAGALAFIIANLTIGYQSIKAALSNPVDSLKSE